MLVHGIGPGGRRNAVRPLLDEDRRSRTGRPVDRGPPFDNALREVDDRHGDCIRGLDREALVRPPLASVPVAVTSVQEAARGRERPVVGMEQDDVGRRRVVASLRLHVDPRREGLEPLAAQMTDRDVHRDFCPDGIVDRGHRRFHVQARLGGRHGDAGDPDDDGREQDDGHGEDQDRADDLGHTRLIFAQDHFHAVASRWAPDNELAPEPTIYKVFAVVTIP